MIDVNDLKNLFKFDSAIRKNSDAEEAQIFCGYCIYDRHFQRLLNYLHMNISILSLNYKLTLKIYRDIETVFICCYVAYSVHIATILSNCEVW